MKKTLLITTIILAVALAVSGCSTTEPVTLNAGDVSYGTSGETVGDTLDQIQKNQGTKPHTHKASEISDFSTAAVKAMGSKGNGNALNHVKYGESDLSSSATIKALKAENATLKTSVSTLQSKVSTLESQMTKLLAATGTDGCPAGYTRDTTVSKYTVCKNGKDEVVKVGDFWIDRYEILVVDAKAYSSGKCDGVGGVAYGGKCKIVDDFPSSFPDSGNWTTPLYACSKAGVCSSTGMTWFQAQQACALAGKHLCTNGEWQTASSGTPDSTLCNINSQGKWNMGHTGDFPKCISKWGAMDMVGNLTEWVDWWGQAGRDWQTTGIALASPWPSTGGYGDGQDRVENLEGQAAIVVKGKGVNGMPAAAHRGGSYKQGTHAGSFYFNLISGPAQSSYILGARCCIKGGGR